LSWQYGCVPADTDRSLERIKVVDLLRLAALAADGEAELCGRNPEGSGRYAGRLLSRALCQGAALHYANGTNGVKNFDVWSSYAQHDGWPFPPRWRGTWDYGPRSSAGTPVTCRVTLAGASTSSADRSQHRPAPTRQMLSAATSPAGALTQRKPWQPKQRY
jgi:hypothetical protein